MSTSKSKTKRTSASQSPSKLNLASNVTLFALAKNSSVAPICRVFDVIAR
jgi:hypothetical protein